MWKDIQTAYPNNVVIYIIYAKSLNIAFATSLLETGQITDSEHISRTGKQNSYVESNGRSEAIQRNVSYL
jgi:hypothetical protein